MLELRQERRLLRGLSFAVGRRGSLDAHGYGASVPQRAGLSLTGHGPSALVAGGPVTSSAAGRKCMLVSGVCRQPRWKRLVAWGRGRTLVRNGSGDRAWWRVDVLFEVVIFYRGGLVRYGRHGWYAGIIQVRAHEPRVPHGSWRCRQADRDVVCAGVGSVTVTRCLYTVPHGCPLLSVSTMVAARLFVIGASARRHWRSCIRRLTGTGDHGDIGPTGERYSTRFELFGGQLPLQLPLGLCSISFDGCLINELLLLFP